MRILLSLIHNNNLLRLETARQTIHYLESELSKLNTVSIERREYVQQDPLSDISIGLWRRIQKFSNESQYRYLRTYLKTPMVTWVPFFLLAWVGRLFLFPSSATRKKAAVEQVVSTKHLQALRDGLDYDFVFVVEDDAVMLEGGDLETGSTLRSLIQHSYANEGLQTYIDFAGGFNLESVAPADSRFDDLGRYLYSTKLFTNTACGYVLSRPLVQRVLSRVESDARLKWLGIDFLLNRVFLDTGSDFKGGCAHLVNSAVGHGSMMGKYASWESSVGNIL
jgi:hypothetical protein